MPSEKYTAEEQAQHRKELVEALRSGKYVQGQRFLRAGDAYCCLGVACDISKLGDWEKKGDYPEYSYLAQICTLPPEVADYFGITFEGNLTKIGSKDYFESLVGLNDGGETFDTIAEFIEKGWVKTL